MKMKEQNFQDIWVAAEELSSKLNNDKSMADIVKSIETLLGTYTGIAASNLPNEIKTSLAARQMGEIVFLLTTISARDNINVWIALENEIKLNME